jgi:uncharacterized membrane protein YbaN (DUF454 family)
MTPPSAGSEPDIDDDLVHPSPLVRALLLVAGGISVALGIVGLVVPVMPTTPVLLVAAACFARASPSLYRRLLASPSFGPLIVEWRRHRSIPWRTKLVAMALMAISLSTSIVVFVRPAWLQATVASLGVVLLLWMYRLPSRDRPVGGARSRR